MPDVKLKCPLTPEVPASTVRTTTLPLDLFVRNGISKETASDLTIAFYHTVLSEAEHRVTTVKGSEAFQELVNEQTPGGLNEKNVIDMLIV